MKRLFLLIILIAALAGLGSGVDAANAGGSVSTLNVQDGGGAPGCRNGMAEGESIWFYILPGQFVVVQCRNGLLYTYGPFPAG